jgi:hypothetical protein
MDFFFCFNDELKIVRFHCSYVIQKRKTLFPQEEKKKLKLNHPIERFQGQTSITFFVGDEIFFLFEMKVLIFCSFNKFGLAWVLTGKRGPDIEALIWSKLKSSNYQRILF